MSRSITYEEPSFKIFRPGSEALFIFNSSSPSGPSVTIRLPERSRYSPSPHWHERDSEHFRVLQGRLLLIINGESRVVTPEDGEHCVERFAVHNFMRADVNAAEGQGDAGEVVIETRSEPADGVKEVFFRNIFSTIQDSSKTNSGMTTLQITLTSAAFDDFQVFVGGALSWYITHAIHTAAKAVGWAAGLKPWYEEYTPQRLREVATKESSSFRPKDL